MILEDNLLDEVDVMVKKAQRPKMVGMIARTANLLRITDHLVVIPESALLCLLLTVERDQWTARTIGRQRTRPAMHLASTGQLRMVLNPTTRHLIKIIAMGVSSQFRVSPTFRLGQGAVAVVQQGAVMEHHRISLADSTTDLLGTILKDLQRLIDLHQPDLLQVGDDVVDTSKATQALRPHLAHQVVLRKEPGMLGMVKECPHQRRPTRHLLGYIPSALHR